MSPRGDRFVAPPRPAGDVFDGAPRMSAARVDFGTMHRTSTRTETTTAEVTKVEWERRRDRLELIAWVRVRRDREIVALYFEMLPNLSTRPTNSVGGPLVQLKARAAVERYIEEHRAQVEWLLKHPPLSI
jgi:hypothetical protein